MLRGALLLYMPRNESKRTSSFGYVLGNDKYHILQLLIIYGKEEGKRDIGRKKLSWLRNIRNWIGLSFGQLIRPVTNREKSRNHFFTEIRS